MAIGISALVFTTVRSQLLSQVDASLETATPRAIQVDPAVLPVAGLTPIISDGPISITTGTLGTPVYVETVQIPTNAGSRQIRGVLPITADDRLVASGKLPPFYSTRRLGKGSVRVLTTVASPGIAQLVARPLGETDATIHRLLWLLLAIGGAATLIGAGAARLLAGRIVAPVQRLSEAADHVAQTKDLSRRVAIERNDEVGRVASDFNVMMDALQDAQTGQRRMIADAAHEIRTPLTSIRTNLEVLAAQPGLSADERTQILADVNSETAELSGVLNGIVSLAHGELPQLRRTEVRLDAVAEEAVARARRTTHTVRIILSAEPSAVVGDPDRLLVALANLIGNATTWAGDGGEVRVEVAAGHVRVADSGPGFEADDVGRVFDRFYRSAAARGTPGSGLGLAIVRQVAEEHSGTVAASNGPNGGGVVELWIPPQTLLSTSAPHET